MLEKCDVGWKYFKEGCYKYFATPKSWENSLDSCRSKGAKLTVVESEEENEYVLGVCSSMKKITIAVTRTRQETWMTKKMRNEK